MVSIKLYHNIYVLLNYPSKKLYPQTKITDSITYFFQTRIMFTLFFNHYILEDFENASPCFCTFSCKQLHRRFNVQPRIGMNQS